MRDAPDRAPCWVYSSPSVVIRKGSVMDDAKRLWTWWQHLLDHLTPALTLGGRTRFLQWVTGLVFCPEEHTITQSLTGMGLQSRWRVVEHFAEYGSWDRDTLERRTMRMIDQVHPARWGKYRPVAVDDTKVHRTSRHVWGTCTFHEASARSPNRATTVRAHNWVILGDLMPGRPWSFLPTAGRLYFRKSQLPPGEVFRTKNELALEMLREADEESEVPILAVYDGAFAKATVVRPSLHPPPGRRRIECVTRLRKDARLYVPERPSKKPTGRSPKWGRRLPAPQHHDQWDVPWQWGRARLYRKMRTYRYKQLLCRWHVSGSDQLIHAYVFEVEGYKEPWYVGASALDLSPLQAVTTFAGRYRQETDGFRDLKQRLGMEECRAWTKEPVLRTVQAQLIAATALRLTRFHLDQQWGAGTWWQVPEWNRHKKHPSLLDLRRLFWRCRERFSQFLRRLEELRKPPQSRPECSELLARAG